jgi:hypothetical protein
MVKRVREIERDLTKGGEVKKMEKETIIILCILVAMVVLPIVFIKFWHRPSRLTLIGGRATTSHPHKNELTFSKAEILEEFFKLNEMVRLMLLSSEHLTIAENNLISRKVNPLRQGAFPIVKGASDKEINKWLNHPGMNLPMPDTMIMSMAEHTPVPPNTIENILKRLLQDNYDSYWRMAEERLKSRITTIGVT